MASLAVIGGGSGFIGKPLCKALEKAGYTAVTITRNAKGKQNAITWEDVKRNGLPNNTDAVFNLAGETPFNPLRRWNDEFISEVYKSRVGTTEILRQAILNASNPPKFWGSVSAIGYYKPDPNIIYDETSEVKGKDFWTELVMQWEDAAKLPPESNARHCIIRTGVVLGTTGGTLQSMLLPFKLGLGGPIGCGNQWFPWIHIDDMVGIFMHALHNDNVDGVLNGVAPKICTNQEFTTTLGSVLHRPVFFRVPSFVLNTLLGPTRASVVLEGQNVYPKRTIESGYDFSYPSIREALANLLS